MSAWLRPRVTAVSADLRRRGREPFTTARGHCRPFGATPRPAASTSPSSPAMPSASIWCCSRRPRGAPRRDPPRPDHQQDRRRLAHLRPRPAARPSCTATASTARSRRRPAIASTPSAVLLDPYARAISGGHRWGMPDVPHGNGNGRLTRRGRLVIDDFDWEGDVPPRTPLAQTVLYELHVRGFTRHPSSGVRHPGTFLGLCEKIPYLKIARRHGGAAHAGAGVRRAGPCRTGTRSPASRCGTTGATRRCRSSPQGGLRRPGRPAGARIQGDGQGLPPRRHRGHPRRGLQPHLRGQRERPDAQLPRPGQRHLLHARPAKGAITTSPAAATRSTAITRWCAT